MSENDKESTKSSEDQICEFELGECMDIDMAAELHRCLKDYAAKQVDVRLNAAKVATIGTSCLQLLLAFVNQLRENGHLVSWQSPSEALIRAARLLGLETKLLLGFP